jgi:hypothetical protein
MDLNKSTQKCKSSQSRRTRVKRTSLLLLRFRLPPLPLWQAHPKCSLFLHLHKHLARATRPIARMSYPHSRSQAFNGQSAERNIITAELVNAVRKHKALPPWPVPRRRATANLTPFLASAGLAQRRQDGAGRSELAKAMARGGDTERQLWCGAAGRAW